MHLQGGDDGRSASERRVPLLSPYEVITLAPEEAASVLANGQLRTIVWTFPWRQSRLVHSVVDQPEYGMNIFAARQTTWWQMWTDYLVQRAADPPDDSDHQPHVSEQWMTIYDRMQESAHFSHFGIARAEIPPPPPWCGRRFVIAGSTRGQGREGRDTRHTLARVSIVRRVAWGKNGREGRAC